MEIGKGAVEALEGATVPALAGEGKESKFDLVEVLRSPAFMLGALVFAAVCFAFWPLMRYFPELWQSRDGYYSHGFLIPLMVGYVVYKWWPEIKSMPAKGSWLALIPLMGVMVVARAALGAEIQAIASLALIAALLLGIAFVGGWNWGWKLKLPTIYLGFAMPLWTMLIDSYTNKLQLLSTTVSYYLLKVWGLNPYRFDREPTTINLNNFVLDVAVPCSGLKLLIALGAFTVFFMMIAKLRWWANAIMVVLLVPFAIVINATRVALIGVVGDRYGHEAGMAFHDYSGYITLILCFFLIFKFVRLLGWKD